MKKLLILLSVVLAAGCSSNEASVNPEDGHIEYIVSGGDTVRFRSDRFHGPAFLGVELRSDGKGGFSGKKGPLEYRISYRKNTEDVVAEIAISNTADTDVIVPLAERLILGVDTEMKSFPQWDSVMFPTLLRCEKDFAWGYFSSTTGRILAFATEQPVASYNINYQKEAMLTWEWGHTIYTASLDLLHKGPLPERHPQNLDRIAAGQTFGWTLHMFMVDGLDEVKPAVAKFAHVPMMELDAYTVGKGSSVNIGCFAQYDVEKTLTDPNGRTRTIAGSKIDSLDELGLYRIRCTSGGKTAEGCLYVRPEWKWYTEKAREYVAKYPPMANGSCEQLYGYLPAFNTARRVSDPVADSVLGYYIERELPLIFDTVTWIPVEQFYPDRIQNYSSLAVILARYYEVCGKERYLRIASKMGDYVMSKQTEDGAYRNRGTHYTCVIYPAKSLFDLAEIEQRHGLAQEAARHSGSAMKACMDLLGRLDNIETEGEMTFEDGMISCSMLQLAYAGLHTDDPQLRQQFTDAAEYMRRKHQCLEQLLVPDCRMRGATLRWWEALDIYFTPNQCMNSPHGWSAWTSYGLYYLYKLTGKECYRKQLENLLGACAQVMELDGNVRWGFIPDPYLDALVCLPADNGKGWRPVPAVVGEQYMERISPWLRPENEFSFGIWAARGGQGDGTTFEIFNSIEELIQDGFFTD